MNTRSNSFSLPQPSFLRLALLADACVSGLTGLMMMVGAGYVDGLLGIPASLLRYAGLSLIPFAALVALVATRDKPSAPAVWAVIAANVAWAVDSILLIASGWIAPTPLGYAFTIGQAAIVACFAELQYAGLRRWRGSAA
jgi:hypothetical protein